MRVVHDQAGRPLYLLWTCRNELFDVTTFHSSLPDELLWLVGRDVLSLIDSKLTLKRKKLVLDILESRLSKCSITKYFHLPDILLCGNNVQNFTLEKFNELINNPLTPFDHVYSDYFNPLWFAAIRFQFYRSQFLDYKGFQAEVVQISRKEFQLAICDQRAASQYVKHYDQHNIFYNVQLNECNVFLMTTGFQLNLVIILKKNENNNN